MKSLIVFIFRLLIKKEKGYIFFKLDSNQQLAYLKGNANSSINITIRYIGVDKRVIESITNRIEKQN